MGSFLALGECMIELADMGGGLYRRGFAGDTFNTAWYVRHLLPPEWTVSYGSAVGTDAASEDMVRFMAGAGIDTSALRRIPERSVGLYMISLENGERSFSYWRSHSAARLLADDPNWLAATLRHRDVIYLSGITLAILSPAARSTLFAALRTARQAGSRVVFDTNLRPRLWEDHATMQAGILAGAEVADIVLPSFDEEVVLFGDASPEVTLARYHTAGADIVAVKNGGGDLHLSDASGVRCLPPVEVPRIVDSTAAGDSFGAGFASGLALGADADTAAAQAMALAAQVIQSRGALVPEIFKGETS